MADNKVGGAIVEIKGEDKGLKQSLENAKQSLSGFAVGILPGLSMVTNSFGGLVAALGIKGLALSFNEVASNVSAAFDEIDDAIDASARTGVELNQLMGLQFAASMAGANGEMVVGALDKLNKATGEALSGNKKFAQTFSDLGISQEQLRSGAPIDTLYAVSDAIASAGSAAERTQIAMSVFGKSGAALLPVLAGGSEALRAQQAEYESIAGVIGSKAQADIAAAQDASDRAALSFTAIWRFAATQFAQVKEVVAIVLKDLAIGFRTSLPTEIPFGQIAINTFEWVAKGALMLFNGLKSFAAGFLSNFVAPLIDGCATVLNGFADMIQGVLGTLNNSVVRTVLGALIPGVGNIAGDAANVAGQNVANNMRQIAGALGTAANGVRTAGAAVRDFELPFDEASITAYFERIRQSWAERGGEMSDFSAYLETLGDEERDFWTGYLNDMERTAAREAEINAERQQSYQTAFDNIAKKIEDFGLTQEQIALRDLESQGVDPQQIAQLRMMQDHLDMMQQAADLNKKFRNPAEAMGEEIENLNLLFASGQIGLDVYNRAMEDVISGAEKAAGVSSEIKLPEAQFSGSAAALQTVLRHQFSDGNLDPQERMLRVQNAQLVQQQQLNRNMEVVAERLPILQGV